MYCFFTQNVHLYSSYLLDNKAGHYLVFFHSQFNVVCLGLSCFLHKLWLDVIIHVTGFWVRLG